MKILLDGQYFADGDLADVAAELLAEDASFDVSRLSHDPDDLKQHAKARVKAFAGTARSTIVQEPDAMRRDGWTVKGVLALVVMAHTDPDLLASTVTPAVINAFTEEAERRGLDESAQALMSSSVNKMLGLLFATSLVEGNQRGIEKALDEAEPGQVEALLEAAKAKAAEDMASLA